MNDCNCTAELGTWELVMVYMGLRHQLAEIQDQYVEYTVDAGELHAEIQVLRA
jgi:hypothetical protein